MYIYKACKDRAQNQPQHASLPVTLRPSVLQGLLFSSLLISLCAQVWTYGLANADTMFASPYCVATPANYEPIIAYMQREHIIYRVARFLSGADRDLLVVTPLNRTVPVLELDLKDFNTLFGCSAG